MFELLQTIIIAMILNQLQALPKLMEEFPQDEKSSSMRYILREKEGKWYSYSFYYTTIMLKIALKRNIL